MLTSKVASQLKRAVVIPAVLLLSLVATGCFKQESEESAEAQHEVINLPVRASVAQKRDISQRLRFSGNIDASRRLSVAPASPGRINRIYVEEGQNVRQGQLLVKMDDHQLQQSAANLNQLKSDYERIKTLKERGSTTQQAYDQMKAAYESAKAGHSLLQTSVELRAPYAGTIIGKNFNDGEIYNAQLGSIVQLAQLGRMQIEIMVPEREFILLSPGQTALVSVDAFRDTTFRGTIHTVNPSLNPVSRTSRVTVQIDNPDRLLKPGMFARVEILTGTKENTLAVPTAAIVDRDGESFVFTVEDSEAPFETKPSLVPVSTGFITEDYAEITSGIDEGMVVLTENNVSLTENTSIRVLSIDVKE
ncbi:efflux RND transporter periplasmic adaptor subunit [Chitinispirillales bacterium ANBcel5]|uniref:efflux RND transporter periplasmic adaptor subunit n=1 Tax=Cellulosispirillum alkaliphilum TaxID=3039283 RepID=UPI002A5618EB|nr:efflux RND transporter periplasmic adaptor subunit [Chitinispirillales bacterium ANBcel5]